MSSDREVVLGELPDVAAKNVLASSEEALGIAKEAIPQYKVLDDFTSFYAKYAVEGDDIVVLFFPTKDEAQRAETPAPVHPQEVAKNPELSHQYDKLTAKCNALWPTYRAYWLDLFPGVLSAVAQEHFKAEYPRLAAKYTDELRSWWFRAHGYAHLLDVDGLVYRFAEKLDQVLGKE